MIWKFFRFTGGGGTPSPAPSPAATIGLWGMDASTIIKRSMAIIGGRQALRTQDESPASGNRGGLDAHMVWKLVKNSTADAIQTVNVK